MILSDLVVQTIRADRWPGYTHFTFTVRKGYRVGGLWLRWQRTSGLQEKQPLQEGS